MFTIFNTSMEIAGSGFDTAVLPMGSVEPKGPHLPAGFDLILAHRFARDFCSGKAVYLLPVFPFSTAMETRGFKGAIALQQQTLWDVLNDVASLLARHGFKRMLVLDFSNYNWILKHAVREINLNREIIRAVWVNPKEFAREAADKSFMPDYGGGAVETSLAMALAPDLVGNVPQDFDAGVPREYIDYDGLSAVAPDGYWGKPQAASAETGKRLYSVMLEKTRQYVDYGLGLFEEGASLAPHETNELWWPEGSIPGVSGKGTDWRRSVRAIAGADPKLAILSTSAIEQHSPCQPLATDYLTALELTRRLADELGAYLLPALPLVTSWGHIRFRGTVTLSAMTVRHVLEDVVESLRAGGFERAAIVNTHGGNWVVKSTMIELNRKYDDFKLIATGDILAYRGQAPVEQLHACEGEASFIQAFYPESFKADCVTDHSPMCSASAFDLVGIGGVSPQGVWGYPSRATVEKGHAGLEKKVADAAAYIRKVFRMGA